MVTADTSRTQGVISNLDVDPHSGTKECARMTMPARAESLVRRRVRADRDRAARQPGAVSRHAEVAVEGRGRAIRTTFTESRSTASATSLVAASKRGRVVLRHAGVWPSHVPAPHAWIEFDVEDVAAASAVLSGARLHAAGGSARGAVGTDGDAAAKPRGAAGRHHPHAMDAVMETRLGARDLRRPRPRAASIWRSGATDGACLVRRVNSL